MGVYYTHNRHRCLNVRVCLASCSMTASRLIPPGKHLPWLRVLRLPVGFEAGRCTEQGANAVGAGSQTLHTLELRSLVSTASAASGRAVGLHGSDSWHETPPRTLDLERCARMLKAFMTQAAALTRSLIPTSFGSWRCLLAWGKVQDNLQEAREHVAPRPLT